MSNYYLSVGTSGEVVLHYGRKGMKWGQHIFGDDNRKVNTRKSKRITAEGAAKTAGVAVGAATAYGAYKSVSGKSGRGKTTDSVKRMSNEELTSAVKRQSLEKTYKKGLEDAHKSDTLNTTKKLIDASNDSVKLAKRMNESSMTTTIKKPRMDLSKMTDKELRDRINRENLELQYNRMFNQDEVTVNKGRVYADRALTATSAVLATTSSALTIALAIKQLKS